MIKTIIGLSAAFGIVVGTDAHLDKSIINEEVALTIPAIPEYKPLKIPNNYLSVHDRYEPRKIPPKKKMRTVRKLGQNRA